MKPVELSVVVPVYDEEDNVGALHEQLIRVLRSFGKSYEILFIDDGSCDGTLERLDAIVAADPQVRVVSFRRNFGKAAALAVAFEEVRGEYVITMDGDLQDDPAEIPAFLEKLAEGYDLVSGWKRQRHDPISKRWPSRVFNCMTAWVSGIPLHDFNCGFKAYRREVVASLRIYGQLHRYIPVLADRLGFRVGEREVQHRPRKSGRSKYGGARFINGFLDLLTVMFLGSSQRNPLHVFGRIGAVCLAVGLVIDIYMAALWIAEGVLRVRPLLIVGVILVVVGIQFVTMGLLAEMITNANRGGETYPVRKRLP